MLLTRYSSTLHACLLVAVWISLLSSFGRLGAIEMPLELVHESINVPKSIDYARRLAFPLVAATDISVEVPPNLDDNFEFPTNGDDSVEHQETEENASTRPDVAQWLQLQQGHQHQPDYTLYQSPVQQKQKHTKHHHSNRQVHTSTTSPASSPLRRCSIEISSKIPGICQSMGSIGNACVSGDYIDVFNAECL